MDELNINGDIYISARRAAKDHKYHSDYLGQLIRAGKLEGRKVGRSWYILKPSLQAFLEEKDGLPPLPAKQNAGLPPLPTIPLLGGERPGEGPYTTHTGSAVYPLSPHGERAGVRGDRSDSHPLTTYEPTPDHPMLTYEQSREVEDAPAIYNCIPEQEPVYESVPPVAPYAPRPNTAIPYTPLPPGFSRTPAPTPRTSIFSVFLLIIIPTLVFAITLLIALKLPLVIPR